MPEIFIPTRDQIESLKIGDPAPDCFGNWKRVIRIYARGNDVNGKAYVCYYTEFGPGASVSNSLKEGEINRTVALTARYTSHELDLMEEKYRKEHCELYRARRELSKWETEPT
jgi:hypothetical protein